MLWRRHIILQYNRLGVVAFSRPTQLELQQFSIDTLNARNLLYIQANELVHLISTLSYLIKHAECFSAWKERFQLKLIVRIRILHKNLPFIIYCVCDESSSDLSIGLPVATAMAALVFCCISCRLL